MVFRLVTFGYPRLADEVGNTLPFSDKALYALAFMLSRLHPRVSRLEMANFLWGENDSVSAQVNLRKLLSRINARQKELNVTVFEITSDGISINRENISADLDDLRVAEQDEPLQALRVFLASMAGEFLSGFDLRAEASQIWLVAERARHISRFTSALQQSLVHSDLSKYGAVVKDAAFRLLELDPYSEVANEALIKVFAKDGQLSQAKRVLADHKGLLWNDLKVAPDQRLLDLMRGLSESSRQDSIRVLSDLDGGAASSAPRPVRLPRLMLLPPVQAVESPAAARLMAALIEDVTIGLCRSKTIAVVAPFTAWRIAAEQNDRAKALKQHDVSYVLETNLRAWTGTPSLFASLSHLGRDEIIWAEHFDASPEKLPSSYNEITRRIVKTVASLIEREEFSKISAAPDAYQNYLIGQQHLRSIDLPDIRRARKSFRAALQESPGFAGALSGLARSEHIEWLLTARGDSNLLRSAEKHSLDAIRADADNASGYHQLGVTKLYQGAFDESIEAFEGAEQSAPSHADVIADYADTLVHASQPVRALEKIERAIEMNPLCPDLYWWTAAGVNYCLERFETALDCISRMEDQSPTTRVAAACWGMLGDKQKAQALVNDTLEIYPDFEIEKWLAIMPVKENWQKEQYREGLRRAGFK